MPLLYLAQELNLGLLRRSVLHFICVNLDAFSSSSSVAEESFRRLSDARDDVSRGLMQELVAGLQVGVAGRRVRVRVCAVRGSASCLGSACMRACACLHVSVFESPVFWVLSDGVERVAVARALFGVRACVPSGRPRRRAVPSCTPRRRFVCLFVDFAVYRFISQ